MTDTPISTKAVERFDPDVDVTGGASYATTHMTADPRGGWVRYEDYEAISAELEQAQKKNTGAIEHLCNAAEQAQLMGARDMANHLWEAAEYLEDTTHD